MSTHAAATIYQSSDLASRRKEIVDNAQQSVAVIRTPNGESVSMLPTAALERLGSIRDNARNYLVLDNALSRPRGERRVTDFGAWAFASDLDEDQLALFRAEVNDALMKACAGLDSVDEVVSSWRDTAALMASGVLDDLDDLEAFVEAGYPESE